MSLLLIHTLFCSLMMCIAWRWQCRIKDAGIVDVTWAALMSLIAISYAINLNGDFATRVVVGLIMGLWYSRLAIFLYKRVKHDQNIGRGEDGRYKNLREYWGDKANFYHFFFFQFQALLVMIFTLPAFVISQQQTTQTHYLIMGLGITILAFIGVRISDKQLYEFRASEENNGKVCDRGLWKYSRHPNYFFEWLHWFAYPVIAIGTTYAIYLWLAPVLMLLFLYFITGIPHTERQAIQSRGQHYINYQKTTSAFFRGFQKVFKILF